LTSNLEIGAVLGGYRIDDRAGQGGMGVVYRATQLGLDRTVALKVITAELAGDSGFRERFKGEAQLAASIDHPNVVPVYEAGEADGTLYLAMRYVEGTDLRALAEADDGLDPARAVRIVRQVAAALDAAHKRGLIHRDVKPPNVLVAGDGGEHAYLTDFGLSKQAAAVGMTRTGHFVGTPDFVAPEQIRGEGLDARADVYALGCLLYHALTGAAPFPRDSELGKMYAHLSDPPPAAAATKPDVPPALDAVIARGMAKEPDERFESAGDLARAAEAALQGAPTPAPEGSVARGAAALGSAAALTPLAAGAPVASGAGSLPPAPPQAAGSAAQAPQPAAAEPRRAGPAGWPRSRRIALLVALPLLLLAGVAAAGLSAAGVFDGEESAAPVARQAGAAGAAAEEDPAQAPAVTATIAVGDGPDGVSSEGDNVFIANSQDGTLMRIFGGEVVGEPFEVAQSPDGIVAGKGVLWVADAGSREVQRLEAKPDLVPVAKVQVGNDAEGISIGKQLVWVANTGDDTVNRIDRASPAVVGDPIGVGKRPVGIFVGSTSVWVTNSGDDTVTRIDPATAEQQGAPIPVGDAPRGVVEAFGSVWIANARDDTITRLDATSGEPIGGPIRVGRVPRDLTAGHGAIWVSNSGSNTVSRIDPETGRVLGSAIAVGRTPLGITATPKAVWVANFQDDTVSRIRP